MGYIVHNSSKVTNSLAQRQRQNRLNGLGFLIDQLQLAKGLALQGLQGSSRTILYNLPDELISQILLETVQLDACGSTSETRKDAMARGALSFETDALRLSHVSRRFMSISRSTTSLWMTVTKLCSLDMVTTILKRSGKQPLHVVETAGHLLSDNNHTDGSVFLQCLQAVLLQAARLKTLKLAPGHTSHHTIAHQVLLKSHCIHLPALVALDVFCPFVNEFWTEWGDDDPNPPFEELLPLNNFPALRKIRVPDYLFDLCASDRLTSFTLVGCVHERANEITYDVEDLLDAIKHMRLLEHFEMHMDFPDQFQDLFEPSEPIPDRVYCTHTALKSFTFKAHSNWTHQFVANIFELASFPNLETLSLELSYPSRSPSYEDDGMFELERALSLAHNPFTKLHVLSLSRYARLLQVGEHVQSRAGIHSPASIIDDLDFLANMPALQEISLYYTIPYETVVFGLGAWEPFEGAGVKCCLPELERVNLYHSKQVGYVGVLAMLEGRVKYKDHARPLQYLRIEGCGIGTFDPTNVDMRSLDHNLPEILII